MIQQELKTPKGKIDLSPILSFLKCETPDAWVQKALDNPELLLIDHAHCEKKAASTALSLMYRYVDYPDLLQRLSRLAREELRHFEQVLSIIQARNIAYTHLSPSRYAKSLKSHARPEDPGRLVDALIIGGIIEARSCERFSKIAPYLDEELSKFYFGLLASESRHFKLYINFAKIVDKEGVDERVMFFLDKETELITSPDEIFRFHSGI